ncbi:MAG: hypothetical protein ACFCGT_04840 [Sandaracinaceae bacterium]
MLLVASMLGCGPSTNGGHADVGPRDGDAPSIPWLEAGGPPVEAPRIPWLDAGVPPIDWPCPAAWTEWSNDGATLCLPYSGEGPRECAAGEAHFPGEPGCRPLGRDCGAGPFADAGDLDPARRLYVSAAATAGGDGSVTAPFTTLADALDHAREGTTVLLASGSYRVDRVWPGGVSVRGRCAAQTSLVAPEAPGERRAVVEWGARRLAFRLEDVTVGPAPLAGIELRGGRGEVWLEAVRITQATTRGLLVAGGVEAHARALVVEDTASGADGLLGLGVQVRTRGRLALERGLIRRNLDDGVLVHGSGSAALLTDVAIIDTQARASDGTAGIGLSARSGALVAVQRGLVARNRQVGVFASEAGSVATLTDVAVLDTRRVESDGGFGWGLGVQSGGALTLTRGLVRRSQEVGVLADGAGSTAQLTDVAVLDTRPRARDGFAGFGLLVQASATLTAQRALIGRSHALGVSLAGDGTAATLTDVAVRDTRAALAGGTEGRGLNVVGAALTLTRGLIAHNRDAGVFAALPRTRVTLVDVAVVDTQPKEVDGDNGVGLAVQDGASLVLERGLVGRNRDVGVFVAGVGASASLTDVTVADTRARQGDGAFGRAVGVQEAARLTVERGVFERSLELGVYVTGADTMATLTDVAVRSTRQSACAPGCATGANVAGINVGVFDGGEARLVRFVLAEADVCGVHITGDSVLRLTDGVVREHPIAICLQSPGYPIALLNDGVRYEANDVRLEATTLPVPALAGLDDALGP